MTTIEQTENQLRTLRRHLRGVPVIGPGEEGWDLRPPGLQHRASTSAPR